MQDRPTRSELLAAVRRFLDEEIIPSTSGRRQFLARVSSHALLLVDREMALEEGHFRDEWRGLDSILGALPVPAGREPGRVLLEGRNRELAERIRSGAFDPAGPERSRLLAHLRQTVRAKLEVSDPALLARDERA